MGNEDNKFSIDAASGRIFAQSLDREQQERYTLTIRARDNGTPSKQNDTTVIITVGLTTNLPFVLHVQTLHIFVRHRKSFHALMNHYAHF